MLIMPLSHAFDEMMFKMHTMRKDLPRMLRGLMALVEEVDVADDDDAEDDEVDVRGYG